MKWLKSKTAKVVITTLLGLGLLTAGVNPKYSALIISGAEKVIELVVEQNEPLIIKDSVENEQ